MTAFQFIKYSVRRYSVYVTNFEYMSHGMMLFCRFVIAWLVGGHDPSYYFTR